MHPLETERLLLRRLSQEDRGDIAGWEAWWNTQQGKEIAAQKFLDFCFREYRESRMGPWGILLKDTGLLVSNCGFPHFSFKQSTGEINYYIAPEVSKKRSGNRGRDGPLGVWVWRHGAKPDTGPMRFRQ